jgi:3-oxoacyl-[acyl-carrier-protein] synthase I
MDINAPVLSLISTGMITAVGGNSAMCAAAVNAGVAGQRESGYVNKRNVPIRMASIPDGALEPLNESLVPVVSGLSKSHSYMLRIASQALRECVAAYTPADPVPVFIACPETIPGTPSTLNPGFIKHLQMQSKANLDLQNSRLTFTGRAGGFEMVDLAFKYLDATGSDFVIVGGVDSYKYCLQQLGVLDSEDRLSVEGSVDGFIPGDAGGFLLLASAAAVQKYGLTPILSVAYPGSAKELGHRYSSEPCRGDGLAEAFQKALSPVSGVQVDAIYTSMNGESFASKELGVAMMRNHNKLGENIEIKHPADCFGDIGAAFGPVLLGLMSRTNKCSSLAYCSADGPYRSAVFAWK